MRTGQALNRARAELRGCRQFQPCPRLQDIIVSPDRLQVPSILSSTPKCHHAHLRQPVCVLTELTKGRFPILRSKKPEQRRLNADPPDPINPPFPLSHSKTKIQLAVPDLDWTLSARGRFLRWPLPKVFPSWDVASPQRHVDRQPLRRG